VPCPEFYWVEVAHAPGGDRVLRILPKHLPERLADEVLSRERLVGSAEAVVRDDVACVLSDDRGVDRDRLLGVGGGGGKRSELVELPG